MSEQDLTAKLERLQAILTDWGRAVAALSGGTDSALEYGVTLEKETRYEKERTDSFGKPTKKRELRYSLPTVQKGRGGSGPHGRDDFSI